MCIAPTMCTRPYDYSHNWTDDFLIMRPFGRSCLWTKIWNVLLAAPSSQFGLNKLLRFSTDISSFGVFRSVLLHLESLYVREFFSTHSAGLPVGTRLMIQRIWSVKCVHILKPLEVVLRSYRTPPPPTLKLLTEISC